MSNLDWITQDQPGTVAAVGRFGIYTIRSLGPDLHVLRGIGHDELPMHSLPSLGHGSKTLTQAKQHAETLDRTTHPESEMSGE